MPVTKRAWNDPNVRTLFKPLGDGRHRVAVVDFRGSDTRGALALIEDVRNAVSPLHRRDSRAGTFGVVLIGGRAEAQIPRAIAGSDELSNSVVPAGLTPWSRAALKNWAHDAGLPFDSDEAAGELARRTGGWDLLVRAAVDAIGGSHTLDPAWAAIAEIHDDPGRLERAAGALDGDPVVSATWELAAEVAIQSLDRKDLGEFLVDDATVHRAAREVVSRSGVDVDLDPASLVDTLLWLGLLVEDAAGVYADPVLLEPRRRRQAHDV